MHWRDKKIRTVQKWMTLFAILILSSMMACRQDATPSLSPTTEPATPVEATAVPPTNTPIPDPDPTATAVATIAPTPILPSISVSAQALDDNGRLQIEAVTMAEAGWVVLFAQRDGQAAEVVGVTAVSAGVHADVTVELNPLDATSTLIAVLHMDDGEVGVFEFPDADAALEDETGALSTLFEVDIQVSLPAINISDQTVGEDGLVQVESVFSVEDGWLIIHTFQDGEIGQTLGVAYVEPGLNEAIKIGIPWREATPQLVGVLYEDNGRFQRFDSVEDDLPVLVGGELIMKPFFVSLPLDVYVLDQPVIENRLSIERVISEGDSWLVVYLNDNDAPGFIIGSVPLLDGLNEQVEVEVATGSITEQLFIFLHDDTTVGDGFDFPANDPPLLYNGRLPNPFSFRVNPGNYLVTQDQIMIEDGEKTAVSIPFAVVDVPAWVTVHADNNGQLGELLGVTLLSPGINRTIEIEIDFEMATETVHAALYLDAGTLGEFEIGAQDVPLQRNRSIIRSPFVLLSE